MLEYIHYNIYYYSHNVHMLVMQFLKIAEVMINVSSQYINIHAMYDACR